MEDGLEAEKKTEIGGKEIWKLKQKPEERWWRPELSCEDGLEEDESRRKPGTYTFNKWYDQREGEVRAQGVRCFTKNSETGESQP